MEHIIKDDLKKSKAGTRYHVSLSSENLRRQFTKRIEANIWKFSDQEDREAEARELALRRLAEVIGSTKKMRKLEIDYTMWMMVRDMASWFPTNTCYKGSGMFSFMRKEMKRLRSLEALKLIFTDSKRLTNLKELSKGVRELTSLKCLDLDLYKCEDLTDEGLKDLGAAMRRLISLKSIWLKFTWCSKLTDQGLAEIGKALKGLKYLEEFSFTTTFRKEGVTDFGLENLSEGLNGLVSLQTLILSFEHCEIADRGLKNLSKDLKKLCSLKVLRLDFGNCKRIGDEALESLSEALQNLDSLEKIDLNFRFSNDITDEGLKSLTEGLKGNSSLKSIRIDIYSCKNTSSKGHNNMREELAHVEKVDIIFK